MGILEQEKEKGTEEILNNEWIPPKLVLDTKPQIQAVQRLSSRINAKTNKQTKPKQNLYPDITFSSSRNEDSRVQYSAIKTGTPWALFKC